MNTFAYYDSEKWIIRGSDKRESIINGNTVDSESIVSDTSIYNDFYNATWGNQSQTISATETGLQ
jgi:hypothetical protein